MRHEIKVLRRTFCFFTQRNATASQQLPWVATQHNSRNSVHLTPFTQQNCHKVGSFTVQFYANKFTSFNFLKITRIYRRPCCNKCRSSTIFLPGSTGLTGKKHPPLDNWASWLNISRWQGIASTQNKMNAIWWITHNFCVITAICVHAF